MKPFADLWPMHGPLRGAQCSHCTGTTFGLLNFYANPMPWKIIFPCSPMAGTVLCTEEEPHHAADHADRRVRVQTCCLHMWVRTLLPLTDGETKAAGDQMPYRNAGTSLTCKTRLKAEAGGRVYVCSYSSLHSNSAGKQEAVYLYVVKSTASEPDKLGLRPRLSFLTPCT